MIELNELYRHIYPNIYAFFYVKTSSKSDAEDLSHDVFYEACKNIHLYKGNATLKTWVFSIAKNILKKHYRSRLYQKNLQTKLTGMEMPNVNTPEEKYFLQEETRLMLEVIQSLNQSKNEIAILRIYGELSFKEIGQLLNKSENYVRVTFHRIKVEIKKEMEDVK